MQFSPDNGHEHASGLGLRVAMGSFKLFYKTGAISTTPPNSHSLPCVMIRSAHAAETEDYFHRSRSANEMENADAGEEKWLEGASTRLDAFVAKHQA